MAISKIVTFPNTRFVEVDFELPKVATAAAAAAEVTVSCRFE
jgi:hypothetical protein